ncbi:zinc finger protein 462-like isoform X2 [Mugil cephalus]|uniref:zinc finger protein 462-like isoform X2 n=1 Tax=Mugil cephalus TaxID=48193 RepID=UPI001FB61AB0|nr:zinc finger protein 462-like isoform X2 [Mugil cephalus]
MQDDSMPFSTSARIKRVNHEGASQETPVEPFRCGHCKLIFKSKVYLFEHLNKVHCFDVDAALREAGLKYPGTKHLNENERRCQRKSENPNATGTLVNSENLHSSDAAGAKQTPSVPSIISTSKNKCTLNSPKDSKRQLQTITKYFTGLPRSDGKPPEKCSDNTNRTLILQGSPSASSTNSSGVFKVTAKSMIDIAKKPDNFVQNDPLLITKQNEQFKEKVCKRINSERSDCHSAKKVKSDIKETKLPENNHTLKQQLSSSSSFEVGEDDEEKNIPLLNGDMESPTVYFCKHCDYKDVSLSSVSAHYQRDHLYIRCNAAYIQDSNDRSATFRCLECPVEFSSTDELKNHHMENHPDSPDVFRMKSHEVNLVFKCFVCPFTTNVLKSLKEHYKEKHPTYAVDNSLLHCQYLRTGCQEESPQLNECERNPSPETSGERSSESARTPCKKVKSSPQHPTSKGTEVPSYKCNHCTFSHKSVVVMQVHYKKKHPDEALSIDKIKQSAHVTSLATSQKTPEKPPNFVTINDSMSPKNNTDSSQKTQNRAKLLEQLKTSLSLLNPKHKAASSNNHSKLPKTKTVESVEDKTKSGMSPTAQEQETKVESSLVNVYAHAEDLYYCQKCNFGNPTILGVLTHQAKTHQPHDSNGKRVINYTALVRSEIEKSKSRAKELSFSTDLPLPIMNDDDEKMFFCHFCNYRRNTVTEVMRHYSRAHQGFQVAALQIHQYTSMVLKKTQQSHSKTAGNQEVRQESIGEAEIEQKTTNSVSASHSVRASQTQRILQCYKCPYTTQYVYHLKMHLREAHQLKLSVTEVLRVGFKQGALQSGYHCELCVFTHEEAAEVYKHYQEQHPERTSSVEFVSTRLFVGPSSFAFKKKKLKRKHMEVSSNPTSVKENDYDHGSKKASVTSQAEEIHELFESYQVPLEFEKSFVEATASSTNFKCPYCSASFDTQHGLDIHCGMKHQKDSSGNSEENQKQEQDSQRLHVFKCPHCTYVNTSFQGVHSHSHMKHPDLTCRADSLHVHLQNCNVNWSTNGPGDTLKFSGHMCEACPHICATLAKLKRHFKKEHNETEASNMPSTFKPAPKLLSLTKVQISKAARTQGSISKASFLSKNKYVRIRCPHCPYVCRTTTALSQHLRVHDRAISKDGVFKCVLCSNSYFKKVSLAGHYVGKHGKDAYLKHFVPIHKQTPKNPAATSPDESLTQQSQNTLESCQSSRTTTADNKILVYRCPRCPYVNASHHGTLTHCQMKHPALGARADKLKTTEIFAANMFGCKMGKGCNERGYMCKKCPKVYASLVKLRSHYERGHDEKSVSEHSAETKNQPVLSCQGSVSEGASLNNKASEVSITDTELQAPKSSQSNSLLVHNKGSLYKCHMCDYKGSCRKYLYSHYKKAHKLDGLNTSKLLQKYNKCKYKKAYNLPAYEGRANLQCKMCRHLSFDSSQLLIDHYCTFHCSDFRSDFTVLSLGFKYKSTGCYKCARCNKQLNGIKKLCLHLDQHRQTMKKEAAKGKASFVITTTPECENIQLNRQDELPSLEAVEEVTKLNLTPVETSSLPTSPVPSPSTFEDAGQAKLETAGVKNTCKQCGRTFMSLEGLRSHERSHAALAAIKKLENVPASTLKNNFSKYVSYKPWTTRPFLCNFCTYRTTVLGLCWRHFIKKHPDVDVTDETGDKDEDGAQTTDKMPEHFAELDEDPELTEKSFYSEPPNVQRQLNHYNLMAQNRDNSKANVQESPYSDNRLLHCEFCSFNTGHLSSMRRHYLNRHGKKMFRCKDCDFFTGLRKTLEMHIVTGHSTCHSQPTHVKDLHCPFCLYQTKNKNNMIDHIVLHREERVVPIEVRRAKLSRYLQGIVFRCHKCTFTSGSNENLRLHMTRHDDIKPYKCRLCYFDCTQLSDLEGHLSDKHQVVRNHELVGQVSIDQLEARDGRTPQREEEPLCKFENHHNDSKDGETEEFMVADCSDVPQAENPAENSTAGKMTPQINEAHHSSSHTQYENLKPKPTVQKTEEHFKVLEQRKLHIEEKVEENILRHIRFLDDDGSINNTPKKTDEAITVKIEQDIEAIDNNHVLSLEGSTSLTETPQKTVNKQATCALAKINHSQGNNRAEKSFAIERHFLILSPNRVQLKLSHKENLDISVANCKQEQLHNQQNCEEPPDLYGEMPILENEYLKEKMDTLRCCKEEEGSDDTEREAGMIVGGKENRCSDQDSPHLLRDSFTTTKAAAEDLLPSLKEDKRFTCEYCGRNLKDTSELKRHIMRHGI